MRASVLRSKVKRETASQTASQTAAQSWTQTAAQSWTQTAAQGGAGTGPGTAAAAGRRWRRGAAGGRALIALMVLLALLVLPAAVGRAGNAAHAGDESAGAVAHRGAAAGDQFPALVALPVAGPLAALGGAGQSLACVQTPVAVDAAGRTGVLAPQVGVTVIRGSAAPSPSLTWVVVPAGQAVGDGQAAVTVCTPMR